MGGVEHFGSLVLKTPPIVVWGLTIVLIGFLLVSLEFVYL